MKLEFIGSLIVILFVSSVLSDILVRDGFSNKSSSTKAHHSIACQFQLEGFLIALMDFKKKTGKYPAKLNELYHTELQRVAICPLNGSPYDDGYHPTDDCQSFIIHCPTGEGLSFTSKDIKKLK